MRPTSRMILVHFDRKIMIILPDGTQALADTRLLPDKILKALDMFPLVFTRCLCKSHDM